MQTFQTSNLYLGAFLHAKGFKFAILDRQNDKTRFEFRGLGVRTAAHSFDNGAKIQAKAMKDSLRTIKDAIFDN